MLAIFRLPIQLLAQVKLASNSFLPLVGLRLPKEEQTLTEVQPRHRPRSMQGSTVYRERKHALSVTLQFLAIIILGQLLLE